MEGHAKDLRAEVDDPEFVRAVKDDFRTAPLDDATRALLEYARKLTTTPGTMVREDVEALRVAGFSDRDITDAAHNVAFFAYINRMASGLGVELESFMDEGGENVAPGDSLPA
jgi:uncharacterized peroxidase-related enzyme